MRRQLRTVAVPVWLVIIVVLSVVTLGLTPVSAVTMQRSRIGARLSRPAKKRVDTAVDQIAGAATSATILLPYEATGYKYLQVDPGGEPTGWQNTGFDDSAWNTGDAAFGSGGDCNIQSTVHTFWATNTTMLLRKHLLLPAGTTDVTVGVAVDNDTNVYWNGSLIGSGVHEGCATHDEFVFSVPNDSVTAGDNLLAAEGVDRGAESVLDVTVSGVVSGLIPPETTGGGNPGNYQTTCKCGSPVNTATGEFYHSWTDLSVPGRGMALDLTRTYSTNLASADSPFGFGWTSSYDWFASVDSTTGDVTIHASTGAEVSYAPDGSGGDIGPSWDFATLTLDATTGNYLYTRDTGESYVFDSSGHLIKEIDRNGYMTALAYSGGNLATVTDPAGRTLTFTHGANGKVASVTDPAGRTVSFTYDGSGDLATATNPGGGTWSFTYDSNHTMTSFTDPRGAVTTNTFDSSGRIVAQIDPMNRKTTLSYTDNRGGSETTLQTDPRGIVTEWDYQNLELAGVTRGLGTPQAATTTYAYEPSTLGLTSVTDPNGHTTNYTYDSRGNQLTKTDPLGRQTTYTYNSFNEVTSVTDPLGVTTTNTYDSDGNLLSTSTPVGSKTAKTTYTYGDASHPGDVTAMTNPDGHTWHYSYDALGDRTRSTDPNSDETTYAYNVIGDKTSMTSPLGLKTKYTYDPFGDTKNVTDPLGNKTAYTYDPDRNLTKVVDANGDVTVNTYDKDNELTSSVRKDTLGTVMSATATAYDKDGNVAKQIDGLGNATVYAYDPLNRVASVTNPLGNATTYSYDLAGNLTSLTDPSSRVTSYSHDDANELTGISYSDGTTRNVTYAYDKNGQRLSMTDGTGTTSYTYDSLHRLIKDVQGSGATVRYRYDLAGSLKRLAYPGAFVVARTYDASNRLRSVKDWLGNKTTFAYDKDSNLTTESYPNGVTATLSYDAADRLSHISDTNGSTSLLDQSYARDKVGLLTSENANTYGYDGANRLASSSVGPSPYAYDKANEITGIGAETLSYDPGNELTSLSGPSGTTTLNYDLQGNRTRMNPPSGPSATYTYDQANRLIGFSEGSTTASYAYDGDGLRTSKIVNGSTMDFVWDTAEGLPSMIKAGSMGYVTGPGGPLEQISGSTVLYYHQDQLGSTRMLTDASGNAVAYFKYNPYGSLHSQTGTATTPFGYAGQYTDGESGLIYLRARHYDPTSGQFMTRDQLADQTLAPYAYAADNPVNFSDPSGQCLLFGCNIEAWLESTGHCIVGTPNCESNIVANVQAVQSSPIGPLLSADPLINLYEDRVNQTAGENISNAQIAWDVAQSFLIVGPWTAARIAGPGFSRWGLAAWFANRAMRPSALFYAKIGWNYLTWFNRQCPSTPVDIYGPGDPLYRPMA